MDGEIKPDAHLQFTEVGGLLRKLQLRRGQIHSQSQSFFPPKVHLARKLRNNECKRYTHSLLVYINKHIEKLEREFFWSVIPGNDPRLK